MTSSSSGPRLSEVRPCRLAALALVTGLSACALATDAPPAVDVLRIRLVGFGLTEQQLEATLCVTNPNANAIGFRQVVVDLDVSGLPLASGRSDLLVRLPASSSLTVPFTVVTIVRNIGPHLLATLQSGSLQYRIHGSVSLDGAFGISIPFARSGRLDLLEGGLVLVSSAADATSNRCQIDAVQMPPRL